MYVYMYIHEYFHLSFRRYYKQRRAIKEEETRDRRKPHETDRDRYYDHDSIVMIDAAGKQISFSDIDDMQLYEEQ